MPSPALSAPTLSVAPAASTTGSTSDTTAETAPAKTTSVITPTPVQAAPIASPTVVTDANIRENIIPQIQSQVQTATTPASNNPSASQNQTVQSNTGQNTGNNNSDIDTTLDGTDYNAIYNKILGQENAQPIDPLTQKELDLITSQQSSVDSGYNSQISGLQTAYNQVRASTQAATDAQNAQTTFQGERTGITSSTTQSIINAENNANLNKMASLTADENTAISNIQTAMSKSDYQSAQDQVTALEKIQSDRAALAQKVTDSLVTQNETNQKTILQAQQDAQISKVFASGVTDPAKILSTLNANGGSFTLAQINTALKNLTTDGNLQNLTGNVKNFYSLKDSGALPSSITSLPADQQLTAFLNLDSSTSASKSLYTTSDGTDITKSDISSGVQTLEASIPAGGKYADPATYEAMYEKWVSSGLDPQEFIKNYPPKYYIDPADTSLPAYLQPGKASSSVANPFSSSDSSGNQ